MTLSHAELASGFFSAIEQNDAASLAALLADDFKIWQSFSDKIKTKEEAIADITDRRSAAAFKFRTIERLVAPEGVADRVEATINVSYNHDMFAIKIAVFFTISDGKIVAINEYFDSHDTDRIFASIRSADE